MFRILIAVLAAGLGLGAAPDECPECTSGGARVSLCRTHKDAEKSRLKAARKSLKSDDADDRLWAYEDVGALTEAHANAPSPAVAELLGKGLDDDDTDVFEACLRMLLQGQHPDTTVEVLLDGLDDAEDRCDDNKVGIDKLTGWGKAPGRTIHTSPEELTGAVSAMIRRPLIFRALGQLPDPRSAEALVDYLDQKAETLRTNDARTAAKMLLGFGTPDTVQSVLDSLVDMRKAAKGKFEQDILGLADELTELTENWARWKAGGEDPPRLVPVDEDAWAAWIGTHLADAPPLERLTEPVVAELPGPDDGEHGGPGQDGQAGADG